MASETRRKSNKSELIAVSVGIVATILTTKYLWTKWRGNSEDTPQKQGYDSLIPFTSKQMEPFIQNNQKFATVEYERIPKDIQLKRSKDFYTFMNMRRSFRHFSNEPVDIRVIENCVAVANSAPSGAHTVNQNIILYL